MSRARRLLATVAVCASLVAGAAWSALPDFNGDGKTDILWKHTDGRAAVWLMNGLTPASTSDILPAGTGFAVTQFGDFNGDGKTDLLWVHSDGRVAVWTMNGSTPVATAQILNAGTGWSPAHAADLDGNGKADIVWSHSDGSVALWLMDGTAPGASAQVLASGSGWSVTHAGDFDGDGKADLYWQHPDGRAAIWLMNGLAPHTTNQILNAGSGWTAAKVADFNGDGKADIAWQHTDGSVAIWLMNGALMASGSGILGAGTGWAVATTADFDGDGKHDLYWQHPDGRAAIWLMNGLAPASTTQILNASSGWLMRRPADLDGNGKADILWAHADGSAAAWLMNGAAMTSGSGILGAATGWKIALPLGTDVAPVTQGGACQFSAQCTGGLSCVDGVCCSSACNGTCEACDLPGSVGTCSAIPNGQDLDNECGAVSCSGYYSGWLGDSCYRKADVPANQATCNGARACRSAAQECALQTTRGPSTLTCDATCQDPNLATCTGTTAGACNNVNPGVQSCGTGICARTVNQCQNGAPLACVPGVPQAETCNNLDDNCDGIVDNSASFADAYEPNNDCNTYRTLPTVGSDQQFTISSATLYPAGDIDYFRINAEETDNTCGCGSLFLDEDYDLHVTLTVPAGAGSYSFCVNTACGSMGTYCQTVTAGSSATWTWPFDGACGPGTDAYSLYVRISGAGSPGFECLPYTLTYRFDAGLCR